MVDLQTMYLAKLGSPQTILAAALAADAGSMVVNDASALPAAPNIVVIGSDENCEIVSYTGISDNTVTGLSRGLGGSTPKAWAQGVTVARNHTSLDHNAIKANIEALNTGKADAGSVYTKTEVDTALSAKANNSILGDAFSTSTAYAVGDYVIYEGALYRFTSAHSAGAWNSSHVTQVVAMNELAALSAQVASRRKFEVSGTASAGSSVTITDSRINDEHWQVPKNGIWFSDSSKVTTQVHWVTNVKNHTITLEATFTGATNVKVDLDWYQDIQSA